MRHDTVWPDDPNPFNEYFFYFKSTKTLCYKNVHVFLFSTVNFYSSALLE